MKKILVGALATMIASFASEALAAPESPFFVGIMAGDSTLDIQSKAWVAEQPSSPREQLYQIQDSQTFSYMLTAGYRFTDMMAIEGQLTSSMMDDKVYGLIKVNTKTGELNSSIAAMGVYSVFQFGEDAYFKARAGVAQSIANFDSPVASASFSATGLSFGAAIGQKLGSLGSVELTFMRYPEIKVSRQKFASDFSSTLPYHSYTTVRRDLNLEVLMVGYVFQF